MTQRPSLPPLMMRLPPPPLTRPALGLALTAFLRRIAKEKPAILSRLGPYRQSRFLLDVSDAPFLLLMQPEARRLTAHSRRGAAPDHDAAIRGGLAAFLAMLHGAEDGDALFFSGELQISGDTSAVLALRNALDDAELDLTEELAGISGQPLGRWLRRGSALVARKSGFILSRQEVMP